MSAWLYQHLLNLRVDFIFPANIVAEQEIVPELLQQEAAPKKIADSACQLLEDKVVRQKMRMGYQGVRS